MSYVQTFADSLSSWELTLRALSSLLRSALLVLQGVDRVPRSMLRKKQVVQPLVIKKGPVEPYWNRATVPQPPLELRDVSFGKTPVGEFLHREWARAKKSEADEAWKCAYSSLARVVLVLVSWRRLTLSTLSFCV